MASGVSYTEEAKITLARDSYVSPTPLIVRCSSGIGHGLYPFTYPSFFWALFVITPETEKKKGVVNFFYI